MYNKKKKPIKVQIRKLPPNTFFKVFANSVSVHSEILYSRFSYEQNDIFFFTPPVGDLLEIEECLHLTNYNGEQFIPNIKFSFLPQKMSI